MEFLEPLPEQCPPADAEDIAIPVAWRVVTKSPPTLEDFLSHSALGTPRRPTVTECDHRSCSLFLAESKVRSLAARLPKPRYENAQVTAISIPQGSGLSKTNPKTEHIHFWMFKSFDPLSAIVQPGANDNG